MGPTPLSPPHSRLPCLLLRILFLLLCHHSRCYLPSVFDHLVWFVQVLTIFLFLPVQVAFAFIPEFLSVLKLAILVVEIVSFKAIQEFLVVFLQLTLLDTALRTLTARLFQLLHRFQFAHIRFACYRKQLQFTLLLAF